MPNKNILIPAGVLVLLGVVLILILSLRSLNSAAQTPTLSIGDIQTAAISTFASSLTQTAAAAPTATTTNTPLPVTPFTFGTAVSTNDVSPTPVCNRLLFVDETIHDHTPMTPGEVFTKTWIVKNVGTCSWQPGYKFALIGGDALGGSTYVLDRTVNPGDQITLAIKMVAPLNQTGSITGTWEMSDTNSTFFGQAVWVTIDVGITTGTASTSTATLATTASSPTATATTPAP